MLARRLRPLTLSALAAAVALTLGACTVYDPAPTYPTYPAYAYAPGYYAAPQSSFFFGYNSVPRYRHHHHHYHHWRG